MSDNRMNKADAARVFGVDKRALRRYRNNGFIFTDAFGTRHATLHRTVIMKVTQGGVVTINNGGWHTRTTSAAIGDAAGALNVPMKYYWHPSKRAKATHAAEAQIYGVALTFEDVGIWHFEGGVVTAESDMIRPPKPASHLAGGVDISPLTAALSAIKDGVAV